MAKTPEMCLFCGNAATTREHVPPWWFLKMFGLAEGPYRIEEGGVPLLRRDQKRLWEQESIPKLTLPACERCNGELNRRFEQPVKEIVRGMCVGRVALTAPDAHAVGIWLLKTWLELAHRAGVYSAPGGFGEPWNLAGIDADLYGWMANGSDPPAGLHIWVSRLDPRADRGAAERHAMLPIGSRVFQTAWSFAAAGLLDVTLIHNATQPIENPLEGEGRAIRLWPLTQAEEADLGALPYVNRRELSWLS